MNKIQIITILVLIALVVFSVCYLFVNNLFFDSKKTLFPVLEKYDCAKEFDKFATEYSQLDYWYGHIVTKNYMVLPDEIFDFFDNRCYTTYKSWMSDSNYEYFIDENENYFENHSEGEQMFHNEIECPVNNGWCNMKENTLKWNKMLNTHCPELETSMGATVNDEEYMNCMAKLIENEAEIFS